ncbi:MAG: SDR family oxidoreductase [Desulfobacteraceae bacterium]|nr:MAG: SDR family oxidoreductase [Desulfobacteraceae bacterium]
MEPGNELFKELFDLTGRVAAVTGATKGLGLKMAETLSLAGAQVAVCSRDDAEARKISEELSRKSGRKCLGLAADVSRKADIDHFFDQISANLGPVDILIANAGITVRKEFTDFSEEEFDETININLKGAFQCAQAVLPGMRGRGWGRIVFIGSIMSFISLPGRSLYSASKAAILGLTRALALECAGESICVNAICPGPFLTPINLPVVNDPARYREFLTKIPVGRFGQPDEIRGLTLLLSSQACSFMTGAGFLIDGAWTAQ